MHKLIATALLATLATASASFTDDFKSQAGLYFSSAITQSVTASPSGQGSIVFKADPDYFGSGDKVNKVLAVESARLFRAVPGLMHLKMTLPDGGHVYTLNISRGALEKHYGLKLAGMDLDTWRTKFTQRYDTKPARADFVRQFVTVK